MNWLACWLSQSLEDAVPGTWRLALAGLRKGDLVALTWQDVDLDARKLTIRGGKAKRVDEIPLHPQLADELRLRQQSMMATPRSRVFPDTVTDMTRKKDFLRAGLAREEVLLDAHGKPIMLGKRHLRPKTRIVTEDPEGRVIDLHAMRTTLGTNLARAGVAPQLAQNIMRHSNYKTTLKHYTVLGLTDTAAAIERLPNIGDGHKTVAATGTYGDAPTTRPQYTPQRERETVQRSATARNDDAKPSDESELRNPLLVTKKRDATQDKAATCDKAGEGTRTLNIQLGRLPAPYGSAA